jgi:hypothetical protein
MAHKVKMGPLIIGSHELTLLLEIVDDLQKETASTFKLSFSRYGEDNFRVAGIPESHKQTVLSYINLNQ